MEPLVFWRETDAGKRGLACHVSFCQNPECTCEEAFIQAFEVDEGFRSMIERGDKVEIRYATRPSEQKRARRVSVVVELSSVTLEATKPDVDPELLAWLRKANDAPARAVFAGAMGPAQGGAERRGRGSRRGGLAGPRLDGVGR